MATDRMQRQRFEMKYIVTEEQAQEMREFVRSHLQLDEFGADKPQFSYPVHSLYLDSGTLSTFWSTINGDKNRFKLRLRFYNELPETPVFFEIKRRANNCILKQRGGARKEAVRWLLAGHLPQPGDLLKPEAKQLAGIQQFVRLMNHLKAVPVAHVAYLREAYIDPVSDSVRVTFDRNVRTEPRNQPDFHTEMVNPSIPFGDRVILELKFTDRFPEWFNGLVSHFGLMQCGAAKYCEGIAGLPGFGLSHAGDFRERMRSSREPLLSQTPCFPGSSDTGNPVAGVSIGSGC